MGNALASCPCRRHRIGSMKEITLLMIGLDNAGKTCTAKHLIGEPTSDAVPTVGFTSVRVKHPKYNISVYDVGGGPKIRGIWKNYYALVHGVIFVVDASEPTRFEECKNEIHSVIKDHRISGKPILLLFNKQDLENAVNEMELVNQLDLEALVNLHQCPTRVEASCALYDEQKMKDPGLQEGFRWLIGHIAKEHSALSVRVAKEKAEQMKMEEKERLERFERVRRIREAREAEQQKHETQKNSQEEYDDDEDVIEGNPFRPINQIKKELEERRKSRDVGSSQDIPGVRVVHVSPRRSPGKREEIILQPKLTQTPVERFEYCNSSSHTSDKEDKDQVNCHQNESCLTLSTSSKEKNRSKKPKKRFKNRIVPQVHQPNSLASAVTSSDLPPLLPARDMNGHIAHVNSSKVQHELRNGRINWALAEELPPSAVYTVPRQTSADL